MAVSHFFKMKSQRLLWNLLRTLYREAVVIREGLQIKIHAIDV
jgi:hypothetical protein